MIDRFDTSLSKPRGARGRASALRRRFVRSGFAYAVLSSTATAYLRFVRATSRLIVEPTSVETLFTSHAPFVATTWHSEAFLLPLLRPPAFAVDAMASRAGDGEIISRSLHKFGFGTVRGSGASERSRMFEKGSVSAFRALKAALDRQHTVFLTADFDARTHGTVSPGVVALARLAQRPIVPMIAVTSNRVRLGSWDRMAFGLPFSRMVAMYADPIPVPRRASESELEEKRLEVERALTAITERAYAIADRRRG